MGATVPSTPPQASCYDANFFDGLATVDADQYCDEYLRYDGYNVSSYENASAQTALSRGVHDAVFFDAGHSFDYYPNGSGGPHTGTCLLYESPDASSSSTLDMLGGDPALTGSYCAAATGVCTDSGTCKSQTAIPAYEFTTPAEINQMALGVYEVCAAGTDAGGYLGFQDAAMNDGKAGYALAFTQDVYFPTSDFQDVYGIAWANEFWGDAAGNNDDFASAAVQALDYVDQTSYQPAGFDSWRATVRVPSSNHMYPAHYAPVGT